MKRFTALLMPLVALISAACAGVRDSKAHFTSTNKSPKYMVTKVDGRDAGPTILPNDAVQFDANIRMSSPSNMTEPGYQEIPVQISMRTIEGDFIARPVSCLAGPRVVTNVTYEEDQYNHVGYVYCWSGVSYMVMGADTLSIRVISADTASFSLR